METKDQQFVSRLLDEIENKRVTANKYQMIILMRVKALLEEYIK